MHTALLLQGNEQQIFCVCMRDSVASFIVYNPSSAGFIFLN